MIYLGLTILDLAWYSLIASAQAIIPAAATDAFLATFSLNQSGTYDIYGSNNSIVSSLI